jgi:hypothetical protein
MTKITQIQAFSIWIYIYGERNNSLNLPFSLLLFVSVDELRY